jgi:glycosyltransferase involved in cell wall biosynthesis
MLGGGRLIRNGTRRLNFSTLGIYDEMLPSTHSPFRTLEYLHYLNFFPSAILASMEGWQLAVENASFEDLRDTLPTSEDSRSRVMRLRDADDIVVKLGYVTFLDNAVRLLPYFKERKIPFIFQLYPGGTFSPNDPAGDDRLRSVVNCELCRKVIVTQILSRDYLIGRIGCDPAKIVFIYGGVYNSSNGFNFYEHKVQYPRDKDKLDICFVAHRYGQNLSVKGYDRFIEVAKRLSASDERLRFHVVGDYRPEDIRLSGQLSERITFHGKQPNGFFKAFYPKMDVILSLNRPDNQDVGPFDGFPTGACMEAGFNGVLNCITDPLKLNIAFRDGQDIVLLDGDVGSAVKRLRDLLADPEKLYSIAHANWLAFRAVFDVGDQLWERVKVIVEELQKHEELIMRPSPAISSLDANVIGSELTWLRNESLKMAAEMADHRALAVQHSVVKSAYEKLTGVYENLAGERAALAAEFENLRVSYAAAEADRDDALARHDRLLEKQLELARDFDRLADNYKALEARQAAYAALEHDRDDAIVRHDRLLETHLDLATAFEELVENYNTLDSRFHHELKHGASENEQAPERKGDKAVPPESAVLAGTRAIAKARQTVKGPIAEKGSPAGKPGLHAGARLPASAKERSPTEKEARKSPRKALTG